MPRFGVCTFATTRLLELLLRAFRLGGKETKREKYVCWFSAADFKWLLMGGGMQRGYKEQSLVALDVAKAEALLTDLELKADVIHLYYGAVLARQLHKLGQDTLERMEATQSMTETIRSMGRLSKPTRHRPRLP